jgi:predicted ATP-binding protein involved in virulence
MKLNKIVVKNYRGFEEASLDFSKPVTCILGVNGSGKTSIMKGISKCLMGLLRQNKLTSKNNYFLENEDIHYTKNTYDFEFNGDAEIRLEFEYDGKSYEITNAISKTGAVAKRTKKFPDIDFLSKSQFPVFALYPANRSELDFSLQNKTDMNNPLSIYDNCFSASYSFNDFFTWFKFYEDIENELYKRNMSLFPNAPQPHDMKLEAVRLALRKYSEKYRDIHVARVLNTFLIAKDDSELPLRNLSDGEKMIITLVSDIARRLAVANSIHKNDTDIEGLLAGQGIIMIDEIDLHLHPSWQRILIKKLPQIFPKCQFIITTHSPQVVGELKPESIRIIKDFKIMENIKQSYGLSSDAVLKNVFGSEEIPSFINAEINARLEEVSDMIDKEEYKAAKEKLNAIEQDLNGSTPDTLGYWAVINTLDFEEE